MGKGNLFVPVRDTEKAYRERTKDDDDAERAHKAFHNPHTLHRGMDATHTSDRDSGQQVVRKAPTLIKNEKGHWVKPDKETLAKMREEWERQQQGQAVREKEEAEAAAAAAAAPPEIPTDKFIASKTWTGPKFCYYFSRGDQGVGYYADPVQLEAAERSEHPAQLAAAAAQRKNDEARGGDRRDHKRSRDWSPDSDRKRRPDGDRGNRREEDRTSGHRGSDRAPSHRDDERRHADRRAGYGDDERSGRADYDRRSGRQEDHRRSGHREDDRRQGRGDGYRPEGRSGGREPEADPKEMTKEERQAAALARLQAARSQGAGSRPGGLPTFGPRGGGAGRW